MKTRSSRRAVVLAIAAAVMMACAANIDAPDVSMLGQTRSASVAEIPSLQAQLARVRRVTARYHDVGVAQADGFTEASECVSAPGIGTMGYHFVSFPRLAQPLSIDQPQAVLYLHEGERWSLVAVEYISPIIIHGAPYFGCGVEDNSCPPANPPPPPSLFEGVSFDGPMAGHEEGMPWHYDQHVWVWRHNPNGTFAPFNPALSCD